MTDTQAGPLDSSARPEGAVSAESPHEDVWAQYLAMEHTGDRRAALHLLSQFVEMLGARPESERRDWAIAFCKRVLEHGEPTPIRHPLFVGILVPFLQQELARDDLPAARWLASLAQHLYSNRAVWKEFGFVTERGFLERALDHDPGDTRSRIRLRQVMWDELRHATHAIPAGVLYGTDGASHAQCDWLLADLSRLEALAAAEELPADQRAQLDTWRRQVEAYRDHLESHSEPSYRALLEKRGLL